MQDVEHCNLIGGQCAAERKIEQRDQQLREAAIGFARYDAAGDLLYDLPLLIDRAGGGNGRRSLLRDIRLSYEADLSCREYQSVVGENRCRTDVQRAELFDRSTQGDRQWPAPAFE